MYNSYCFTRIIIGLFWWLTGTESACQCRRHRFNLWVRKSPGEGNGNPLQYFCLRNSMDKIIKPYSY